MINGEEYVFSSQFVRLRVYNHWKSLLGMCLIYKLTKLEEKWQFSCDVISLPITPCFFRRLSWPETREVHGENFSNLRVR